MKNSRKNQLLALLPPAAALAAALAGGVALQPFPDAGDYLALAEHFNSGFELGTQVPVGWRTPGYPALLFAFGFAGKYGYLLLNMLALYFTALILLFRCEKWNIDRRIFIAFFTTTAGVAALGASAMSETVFVLFLVLNLELMCRRGYLPAALALAVAALIRPAAMFLWVPEAAWIIAVHGWRKWRLAILFAIASNLLVLGWSFRNMAVCNHFAYTSHSGRYACFYKMGASEAKAKKIDFENVIAEISGSVEEELQKSGGDPNDEFAIDAAATRVFIRYAAHHPGRLAGAPAVDPALAVVVSDLHVRYVRDLADKGQVAILKLHLHVLKIVYIIIAIDRLKSHASMEIVPGFDEFRCHEYMRKITGGSRKFIQESESIVQRKDLSLTIAKLTALRIELIQIDRITFPGIEDPEFMGKSFAISAASFAY